MKKYSCAVILASLLILVGCGSSDNSAGTPVNTTEESKKANQGATGTANGVGAAPVEGIEAPK